MRNRIVTEAIVDLYFLVRSSIDCSRSNRVLLVVSVVVSNSSRVVVSVVVAVLHYY